MLALCTLFLALNQIAGGIFLEILKNPEEFTPGKHHVIILKVTNNEFDTIKPLIKFILPDRWSIVTKPTINTLEKGETARLIYIISLPKNTKHGSDSIAIALKVDDIEVINKVYNIKIKEIYNIQTIVVEKPEYLKKGDFFSCKYLISNKGNVDEKIELTSTKGIIENKIVNIPSDSSILITVKQKIPQVIQKTQTVVNNISIYSIKKDTTYYKSISLMAYPNTYKKDQIFSKYPIQASLLYNFFNLKNNKFQALQYDIYGKGYIDRTKKHNIEVTVRGSDRPQLSRFKNYSEHRIRYIYENNDITVGDFTLNISRLLENVRLGRGFTYKRKLNKFEINTFYTKLRFSDSVKNQLGGYLGYYFDKNKYIKLNAVHKNHIKSLKRSLTASLSGVYKNKNFNLQGEFAISSRESDISVGSSLTGYYKKNNFQVNGDCLYTQANFEGSFNNSLLISANARYNFNKYWRISSGVNYSFINPNSDSPLEGSLPFQQNYSANIHYTKNKNQRHLLRYGYRSKSDRNNVKQIDFNQHILSYSLNMTINNFNFRLNNALSQVKNQLIKTNNLSGISIESSLFGDYKYSKNFRLGGNFEYQRSNWFINKNEFLFYGGNISYQLKNKLQLNANYRNNIPIEEINTNSSLLNLDIIYTINADHTVSISARNNATSSNVNTDNNFHLVIKYSNRFNIPTSKNKDLGKLIGQIFAKDFKIIRGIPVHLSGFTTITDEGGIFEFNNIPKGKHFLTIDRPKSVSEYITKQDLPIEVDIIAQERTNLFIDLIKPVKINGKIFFEENKQIQSKEFKNKLPKFVIKLHNDKEDIFYTLINNQGEFSFNEIKPGNWKVSIVTKGFERKFEFSKKTIALSLADGENIDVNFMVKAKSRKFNIQKNKIRLNSKS